MARIMRDGSGGAVVVRQSGSRLARARAAGTRDIPVRAAGGIAAPGFNGMQTSEGLFGDLLGGVKDFLKGGISEVLGGGGDDQGSTPGSAPINPLAPPGTGLSCPDGFTLRNGECVTAGFGGFGERVLPGGNKGTLADRTGRAVMGGFGLPALVPAQVGQIMRNDGSVGPILRCPAGLVLGRDNLCYPKQILSRRSRFRKHRLPPRPPVTGGDVAAIRRAERTRERVAGLAKDVGLKVKRGRK